MSHTLNIPFDRVGQYPEDLRDEIGSGNVENAYSLAKEYGVSLTADDLLVMADQCKKYAWDKGIPLCEQILAVGNEKQKREVIEILKQIRGYTETHDHHDTPQVQSYREKVDALLANHPIPPSERVTQRAGSLKNTFWDRAKQLLGKLRR